MTPFTMVDPNRGAMGVRGRTRRLGTKARDALQLLAKGATHRQWCCTATSADFSAPNG